MTCNDRCKTLSNNSLRSPANRQQCNAKRKGSIGGESGPIEILIPCRPSNLPRWDEFFIPSCSCPNMCARNPLNYCRDLNGTAVSKQLPARSLRIQARDSQFDEVLQYFTRHANIPLHTIWKSGPSAGRGACLGPDTTRRLWETASGDFFAAACLITSKSSFRLSSA